MCSSDLTALVFARFGTSVLAPSPLPFAAEPMEPPTRCDASTAPAAAWAALSEHYGFDEAKWELVTEFAEWMSVGNAPIRIHLARSRDFEAPHADLHAIGGVFKHISELRGIASGELPLVRRVFNLIMGGR